MTKKIIYLSAFGLLVSCSSKPETQTAEKPQNQIEETQSIGGNKDENDCYTSAGYTWSFLKNDCVQLFEVGQRLNPIKTPKENAIISAFVILSEDKSKAELFIDDQKIILPLKKDQVYEKNEFRYDYYDCTLHIDGTKTHQLAKK